MAVTGSSGLLRKAFHGLCHSQRQRHPIHDFALLRRSGKAGHRDHRETSLKYRTQNPNPLLNPITVQSLTHPPKP